MKKFIKGCLFVASGLCVVGILMIILCGVFGGKQVFAQALENNEFSIGPTGYHMDTHVIGTDDWKDFMDGDFMNDADYHHDVKDGFSDEYNWDEDDFHYDEMIEELESDSHAYIDASELTAVANQDQVQNLELKIGAAQLEIMESDDNQYWIQCDTSKIMKCYIEGDTLVLKGVKKIGDHHDKIYLYVPAGMRLNSVDVELGAGEITVERLQCEDLETSIGAGQIQYSDMNVGELKMEIGAGQADYNGIVQQDMKVECAAGQVNLMLQGNKTDWNYDVNCAAGEIMLEDTRYNNLLNEVDIDNSAAKDCKMECVLGQIQVGFYQKK